jgi:hypothetical protein
MKTPAEYKPERVLATLILVNKRPGGQAMMWRWEL